MASSKPVHLGYAVPTGTAVEIPLRHMAVCGQTQEAGKTTALEALITRAGVRAITFVTKRGEGIASITCPVCQRVSYNPNDIQQRYCGACHRFHDDPMPETAS